MIYHVRARCREDTAESLLVKLSNGTIGKQQPDGPELPYQIGYHIDLDDFGYTLAWIISNFNPLCNVIIYPLRQRVVRMGIKSMFTGKIMPDDIRMWYVNQNAVQLVSKPLVIINTWNLNMSFKNHQPSYRPARQPLRGREVKLQTLSICSYLL